MRGMWSKGALAVLMLISLVMVACGGKNPPVARPAPPPPLSDSGSASTRPPSPPEPVSEPTIVPAEPLRDDRINTSSLDDLNRNSPLKPAFFELDSSELSADAQRALTDNATLMKANANWSVSIEGHCDERGTPIILPWGSVAPLLRAPI